MTPSLAAVFDDLVAFAAEPRFSEPVAAARAAFAKRTGSFEASDPWFEERTAASWDRVLVSGLAARMALDPPAHFGRDHLAALHGLSRAQRGLFEVHPTSRREIDLLCVLAGASFRLAAADDATRTLSIGGGPDATTPGLLDAYVAPMVEGVAILPGLLLHPPEATDSIREIVADARAAAMPHDELLDALLAMRHRLAARSRMKAKQVYRADTLHLGP